MSITRGFRPQAATRKAQAATFETQPLTFSALATFKAAGVLFTAALVTAFLFAWAMPGVEAAAARVAPLTSFAWMSASRAQGNEAEARQALEQAFRMLRGGDYGELYEALPSASQRRISRERFVAALNRVRGMYELERLEISSVRVAGDLAVVDTVIYGRALRPFAGEGKIVARQYLLREDGRWRVTTSDRTTVRPLLAAHPDFARRFPPREPHVYVKRDNNWVDISTLANSMRRGNKQ